MHITSLLTDDTVLAEIGSRLNHERTQQELTQAQLSQKAGISKRTLERAESGQSIQFSTFVRLLRALNMIEHLNLILPEDTPTPMQRLNSNNSRRQRVRAKQRDVTITDQTGTTNNAKQNDWKWDED